jgi:transcriptional regulator with XRE-family HTH domain
MTVNEAARALRQHVGKTQQVFATELGLSLRAYQAYEQKQVPDPRPLLTLQYAAEEAGRIDLAQVFRRAFRENVGSHGEMFVTGDEFEATAVSILLGCIHELSPSAHKLIREIAAILVRIQDPGSEAFTTEAIRRGFIMNKQARRK